MESQGNHNPFRSTIYTIMMDSLSSSCCLFPCLESVLSSSDLAALILSHLTMEQVVSLSLVSKSLQANSRCDALWKLFLERRWNVQVNQNHYYQAYQRAFQNPQDLWITHSNIVWPWEGIVAGQCGTIVVQDEKEEEEKDEETTKRQKTSSAQSKCHACRKDAHNSTNTRAIPPTRAQAMAEATRLVQAKLAFLHPDYSAPSAHTSKRAFASAGTLNRKLDTQQYVINEECLYLNDLLFFNVQQPEEDEDDIYDDDDDENDEDDDGYDNDRLDQASTSQPTNHSWHVTSFTNPTFRPILYEIVVQRPDCFAVYPSHGYLAPGTSTSVVFSVHRLASRILQQQYADHCSSSRLPLEPYLVRYRFAMQPPLFDSTIMADPSQPPLAPAPQTLATSAAPTIINHTHSQVNDKRQILDYHWRLQLPAHTMRTIPLAAHVHEHYHFYEFTSRTCQPIAGTRAVMAKHSVNKAVTLSTFVAPCLQELYPQSEAYQILSSGYTDSATDIPTGSCDGVWSLRDEELHQAYIVMKGECAYYQSQERRVWQNLTKIVSVLSSSTDTDTASPTREWITRTSLLLNRASRRIKAMFQSARLVGDCDEKRKELLLLQTRIDELRCQRQSKATTGNWARSGEDKADDVKQRDKAFRSKWIDSAHHVWESTEYFYLGPHLVDDSCLSTMTHNCCPQTNSAIHEANNNPIGAVNAAIGLMRNPYALTDLGVYDRISYPGVLLRRPKVLLPAFCRRMNELEVQLSLHTSDDLLSGEPTCRLWYYKLMNGLDVNAILDVHQKDASSRQIWCHFDMFYSMHCYLHGIPPPGTGRFPLSRREDSTVLLSEPKKIISLDLSLHEERDPAFSSRQDIHEPHNAPDEARIGLRRPIDQRPVNAGPRRRLFRVFWTFASQLGLDIRDDTNASVAIFNRRTLIAAQWICLFFMAAPLAVTLTARYMSRMPTQSLQQELNDLLYSKSSPKDLRFLSARESGAVALILLVSCLCLGRWAERNTCRDYSCILDEHVSPPNNKVLPLTGWHATLHRSWIVRRIFVLWNAIVPHFIQSLIFLPPWTKRSRKQKAQHSSFWSGQQDTSIIFSSAAGRSDAMFGDDRDKNIDIGLTFSLAPKVLIGVAVTLCSFCCCTPHFWVNLLTIITCSLGFGMSVSLQFIDQGSNVNLTSRSAVRNDPHQVGAHRANSLWKSLNLVPVVILSVLTGQLVGSSGGTMFLAEFVVTSISLILGGAGTVSSSAMKSWLFFFGLASSSFWVYLFGRVAIMDIAHRRRGGVASRLLCTTVVTVIVCWSLVVLMGPSLWVQPANVLIQRDYQLKGQYLYKVLH
jgi:hypothetical protein